MNVSSGARGLGRSAVNGKSAGGVESSQVTPPSSPDEMPKPIHPGYPSYGAASASDPMSGPYGAV